MPTPRKTIEEKICEMERDFWRDSFFETWEKYMHEFDVNIRVGFIMFIIQMFAIILGILIYLKFGAKEAPRYMNFFVWGGVAFVFTRIIIRSQMVKKLEKRQEEARKIREILRHSETTTNKKGNKYTVTAVTEAGETVATKKRSPRKKTTTT